MRTYMTAEVHIILAQAKDVLTIPSAALGTPDIDGRYTIRVVSADGGTSERQVVIGLNNKVTAEVRSGLEEGEQVVTGEVTAKTTDSNAGGPPPMGL